MATIFRAVDTQLGRDVAVKLLRPEYLRDPDFSARFRQEAQAAASLTHPNVVTVYDYGEDPSGPYIVMELVDGEDLATILRRERRAAAAPGRPDRRRGRPRARRGARARPRPSRRQARQHPDRPRRPGQGRRLRHRPGDRRGPADAARARRSARSTTSARSRPAASPRRPRPTSTRSASSCTRCSPGVRPWEGDSAAAVGLARLSGPVPDPMAVRAVRPARPRRDHAQGAGPRARRPVRLRGRDGRRPRRHGLRAAVPRARPACGGRRRRCGCRRGRAGPAAWAWPAPRPSARWP